MGYYIIFRGNSFTFAGFGEIPERLPIHLSDDWAIF